jgi:hypothetical protein
LIALNYLYSANFKDMAKIGKTIITHGESWGKNRTKEYQAWAGMLNRCTNTKSKRYPEWGGRGITVCARWLKYENFLEDMGRAPSPKHSVDRIKNELGYSKENCRWATPREQSNNTRRTVKINYNGEDKTIREWCDVFNISYKRAALRLFKGWSPEKTFTTPFR